MAKKKKTPVRKRHALTPRQPIGNMPSEELALLLGEQYEMIMQSRNNITAINNVLEQRKQALAALKKKDV
jgi:hypothetical protein